MEFLNSPVNREKQLDEIIKDTDEIIQNLREFSRLIIEKYEHDDNSMLNLGRRIVHSREEQKKPEAGLGNEQVNFI